MIEIIIIRILVIIISIKPRSGPILPLLVEDCNTNGIFSEIVIGRRKPACHRAAPRLDVRFARKASAPRCTSDQPQRALRRHLLRQLRRIAIILPPGHRAERGRALLRRCAGGSAPHFGLPSGLAVDSSAMRLRRCRPPRAPAAAGGAQEVGGGPETNARASDHAARGACGRTQRRYERSRWSLGSRSHSFAACPTIGNRHPHWISWRRAASGRSCGSRQTPEIRTSARAPSDREVLLNG
jgi:hypothetical protein